VSTVIRPVTQLALVAVKSASSGCVNSPEADEKGITRRSVPSNINAKNPKIITFVGDILFFNGFSSF
jgi:hypothetical protein